MSEIASASANVGIYRTEDDAWVQINQNSSELALLENTSNRSFRLVAVSDDGGTVYVNESVNSDTGYEVLHETYHVFTTVDGVYGFSFDSIEDAQTFFTAITKAYAPPPPVQKKPAPPPKPAELSSSGAGPKPPPKPMKRTSEPSTPTTPTPASTTPEVAAHQQPQPQPQPQPEPTPATSNTSTTPSWAQRNAASQAAATKPSPAPETRSSPPPIPSKPTSTQPASTPTPTPASKPTPTTTPAPSPSPARSVPSSSGATTAKPVQEEPVTPTAVRTAADAAALSALLNKSVSAEGPRALGNEYMKAFSAMLAADGAIGPEFDAIKNWILLHAKHSIEANKTEIQRLQSENEYWNGVISRISNTSAVDIGEILERKSSTNKLSHANLSRPKANSNRRAPSTRNSATIFETMEAEAKSTDSSEAVEPTPEPEPEPTPQPAQRTLPPKPGYTPAVPATSTATPAPATKSAPPPVPSAAKPTPASTAAETTPAAEPVRKPMPIGRGPIAGDAASELAAKLSRRNAQLDAAEQQPAATPAPAPAPAARPTPPLPGPKPTATATATPQAPPAAAKPVRQPPVGGVPMPVAGITTSDGQVDFRHLLRKTKDPAS